MNYVRTMLLLAAMTALFMGVGWLIGGTGGMLIALLFAVGTNAFAFWNSDRLALSMHNAEPVTRASAPDLYEMVGALAASAGLPMPKVYLIRSDQPNAFATGRNPQNGAVAVTTGILQSLDRDELRGVIAHELAHIRNRDTLTMTVAATVAGAISMLAQFGFFFGRGNSDRSRMGPLGVLLAVIFAPMAAMLIQMTISRTREYSADRLGAGDQRRSPRARDAPCARSPPTPAGSNCRVRSATRPRRLDVHRQSPDRRAHGQPLLDPSECREPHPCARGACR